MKKKIEEKEELESAIQTIIYKNKGTIEYTRG